jgi:hypothetical protein
MEGERFGDGEVVRRGVRPDLLVLAYVVVHLVGRGHEWPDVGDLLATHVQEPCAVGREEPLVEAGGVVVAIQVGDPEVEVRQRVSAVDDHRDAVPARHPHHVADRQDLSGEVDHVTHQDQPRPRCDGGLEAPHHLRRILRGHG